MKRTALRPSTTPLRRTRPLRPVSTKRRREVPLRTAVRNRTLERAGYTCEARLLVPHIACEGSLEVHEVIARSAYPGGHLDVDNTMALCGSHHRFATAYPAAAERLGLRKPSWERGAV